MATRVIDLYKDKADEIAKSYESGKHYKELAKEFECSNNTMMITLGVLGYEVEPWAQEQVKKKLDYIAKEKAKRVRRANATVKETNS
ncbi:hypothetical protein [Sulfurimonas sp.]|uniref:hypothetical protein n=1 Tax=Sulfurimonas sp. TaxID=2022749 RepID=UPI0035698203